MPTPAMAYLILSSEMSDAGAALGSGFTTAGTVPEVFSVCVVVVTSISSELVGGSEGAEGCVEGSAGGCAGGCVIVVSMGLVGGGMTIRGAVLSSLLVGLDVIATGRAVIDCPWTCFDVVVGGTNDTSPITKSCASNSEFSGMCITSLLRSILQLPHREAPMHKVLLFGEVLLFGA